MYVKMAAQNPKTSLESGDYGSQFLESQSFGLLFPLKSWTS
jgi:hypothetical protein